MTDLREALRRTSSLPLRGALERTQERAGQGRRPPSAALVWQGPWQADVRYRIGDVVEHHGSSWRCLVAHSGSEPPELPAAASVAWELVAAKGEPGAPGPRGFIGPQGPAGPAGGDMHISDEGVDQGTATTLDFVGGAVTASVAAGVATITVTGTGGGSADFLGIEKWSIV